jgi:hypothetical protein
MGEWLNQHRWDAWCTLTFRAGNFSAEAATRAYEQWLAYIATTGSPSVTWFMGHEVGGQGGRLHLHGLIGNLESYTSRTKLWEWWFKRYGRAQVLRYDAERGASYYVSKYVTKGLAEWNLDLTGYQVPRVPSLLDSLRSCDATPSRTRPRRPCGTRTGRTPSPKD